MGAARPPRLLLALLVLLAVQRGSADVTISTPVIDSSTTAVASSYEWVIAKTADATDLQVSLDTPATVNYRIVANKRLTSQQVTVAGSFGLSAGDPATDTTFPTPTVTVSGASGTPTVTCSPAASLPSQCTFSTTWSNSDITASTGGTVTVSVGSESKTVPYSFTGTGSSKTVGDCAMISDSLASGQITEAMVTWTGNRPPAGGIQTCTTGDTIYEYTGTFANLNAAWCDSTVSATNTANLAIVGGQQLSDSATVNLKVGGCTGVTATIGSIKTTVIESYTWTLDKTGGGSGLTTTPDKELSVPFTITATRTSSGNVGYVAGSVSIQNTGGGSMTISGITVTAGSGNPTAVAVSGCTSATLATKGASTSCAFNVSNPAAPAAGSVSATVTYSSGAKTGTADAAAVSFDYNSADTYSIGGTANIYDVVDTSGLSSTLSTLSNPGSSNLVRFEPASERPPGQAPGLTLSDSRTFTYNLIISKLLTCTTNRVVSNTATLTPVGSTQGSLTKSAQVSFAVQGCDVLPAISLGNVAQWAAVTWSWAMTKTATPGSYQLAPGQGGTASYQVQLTRTQSSGNYWLSGQLQLTNPATFPMYISSVQLVSTGGQFGAIPTTCLGGSSIGGNTISGYGEQNTIATTSLATGNPLLATQTSTVGSFLLAAGAMVQCNFNVTAGTGAPPFGNVYASATTTGQYVSSAGNLAMSSQVPINFQAPTKQWDIGGCVMLSDSATSAGSAGAWMPQLTGLPQQQQICETRTFTYAGTISPVPMMGAVCGTPVTITNTAQAVPQGGGAAVTSSAQISVSAINCQASPSPAPLPTAPSPSPATRDDLALSSNKPLVVAVMPGVDVEGSGAVDSWAVSITNNAQDKGIVVPFSGSRSVQYTVTATRGGGSGRFYVSGTIQVANPNTVSTMVQAASAEFPAGSVPAVCPRRLPASLPAGQNMVCAYNASLPANDPDGLRCRKPNIIDTIKLLC